VSGPVNLVTPAGVRRIDVRCAEDMRRAVFAELAGQDVFIAAAAVADFPRARTPRAEDQEAARHRPHARTRAQSGHPGRSRGTAAVPSSSDSPPETHEVERYARDKLQRKKLDMIAANRVGEANCGFDAERNALSVYWPGGQAEIAEAAKLEVAAQLLDLIAQRMAASA
jgi:phosphopantothenoylcysteine decarboxylase/phosphopantothenate--cysteine ligase